MKKILYYIIVLTFAACKTTYKQQENLSILQIIDSAQYGRTHAFSEWQGMYWEVFVPDDSATHFEALEASYKYSQFLYVKNIIEEEFGEPQYNNLSMPSDLSMAPHDNIIDYIEYNPGYQCYWWINDTLAIILDYTPDGSPDTCGSSWLKIYQPTNYERL